MTILTKIPEKKSNKLITPLVDNEQLSPAFSEDVESATGNTTRPRIIIFPARAHRVSAATTLCLLLTALCVVGIGICGGKILYNEYLRIGKQSKLQGWAQIPMMDDEYNNEDITENYYSESDIRALKNDPAYLHEKFEIDDTKKYEKIDVPDFRDGRSGRFIHDFNTNTTGIIDITGHRCFIMPLNRDNVLPPRSLFDLIQKMWDGYYKVDTDIVRKSMRVVIPPLEDSSSVGGYIASECEGLPIYRLEKVETEVVKRSVSLHPEAKFRQFAGRGITEIDILNLNDVLDYEQKLNSH